MVLIENRKHAMFLLSFLGIFWTRIHFMLAIFWFFSPNRSVFHLNGVSKVDVLKVNKLSTYKCDITPDKYLSFDMKKVWTTKYSISSRS